MTETLALSLTEIGWLALICFAAGVVRGFSGFALSAMVMAIAVLFLPPIELIPMLWYLEVGASLMMLQGGLRDADRSMVAFLVGGTWAGWPFGLMLTQSLDPAQSKRAALAVIMTLAALQLARLRLKGRAGPPGTLAAGVLAGIISGLAHVGGMVVALFVLAQATEARAMRGTLVLYLLLSLVVAFIVQIAFGVMTETALWRGLAFLVPTLAGVWVGTRLFSPRWEPWYRPACLGLLIGLPGAGLLRSMFVG